MFVVALTLAARAEPVDLQPNHLGNPNATPIGAGDTQIDLGGASLLIENAVFGTAVVGVTDRLAVYGGGYYSVGMCMILCGDDLRSAWQVGARYTILQTPSRSWSLAPWVAFARGTTNMEDPGLFVDGNLLHAGLAVEGGSEHARLDLSVPFATYGRLDHAEYGATVDWMVLNTEVGISYVDGDHALRLGVTGTTPIGGYHVPIPALSWRWQPGVVGLELGLGPVVSGKLGFRF